MSQIIIFITILLLFLGSIFLFQRKFIYFPDKRTPKREVFEAEDFQVVSIKTTDNLTLNSWYHSAKATKPTILYLHGNAGHIGYRTPLAKQFTHAGLGVFLLEYRGYGGNEGSPSEHGLYKDGQAAINYLKLQGVNPEDIVLYGESLGTGVAIELAAKNSVCAIVLQSPFSSFKDLAKFHYPWLYMFLIDKYNSITKIQEIHTPLLILHGKNDKIVPFTQGLKLYKLANQPKEIVEFPGKGHNNLWDKNFAEIILNFINQYCIKK